MSTITSPRPSTTSLTSSTPTASTPATPSLSRTASPTRSQAPQRRNRTALRDYYNLKSAAPVDASNSAQHEDADVKESELDAEGFDAEAYVRGVLAGQGLEGVLKVEGGLINEIKGLDGERKALVYDNYSKLITATDTIRRMRTNMDPLTPTTSTLSPAIALIAETAKTMAGSRDESLTKADKDSRGASDDAVAAKKAQRDTVRWVLGAPERLQSMLDDGKSEEADNDWAEVQRLLQNWDRVVGVEELKTQCLKVMERQRSDSNT